MRKPKVKSGRGGDHGGRKPYKYGEETKPVVTRVPKSKIKEFKEEVKEKVLKKWEVPKGLAAIDKQANKKK